jgi:hypothetical protein
MPQELERWEYLAEHARALPGREKRMAKKDPAKLYKNEEEVSFASTQEVEATSSSSFLECCFHRIDI